MIKYIDELTTTDLKGKKVLLRLDLNVPLKDGEIEDTTRLDRIIPTVDFLREKEAQVIIISHLENKEGENESLYMVWSYLNGFFPVDFCPTFFSPESVQKILNLKDKGVLMMENVRFNPGEKQNDQDFAKKLAQMGDIYVNDSFAVDHRKHASLTTLPYLMPHYGGLLLKQEIENLKKAFNPENPFIFIQGGAKFETKIPLIKKYLQKADTVFVGGALMINFFKEKGFEVGTSLISEGDFELKELLENPKLILPVDVTVTGKNGKVSFKKPDEVLKSDCIVDVGVETLEQLKTILKDAKTIIWNGPMGNYEEGFKDKTESFAEIIAEATTNGAESIVGGGDTLASINSLGLDHKFTFISTGGGAMLDFLVNETLPALQALEDEQKVESL